MGTRSAFNSRLILWALALAILIPGAVAETLCVDSRNGNDGNPGTTEKPLRTISEASRRVKSRTTAGPTKIVIAPGVYNLTQAVEFESALPYTEKDRLVIEASILPDDPNWAPSLMPVVLSTEDPRKEGRLNDLTQAYGLRIKLSYATIRGLKFLGNPLVRNWYCAVERVGKGLEDLVVTQCLFAGSRETLDIYCPVIGTGDGLVVDHCVFYKCHASAVFWDGPDGVVGRRCAMRYCIVDGGYISGVWTCRTGDDFEFHHNIVTRTEYFWLRPSGTPVKYRLDNCVVANNRHYSGYGVESGPTGPTGPEITYDERDVVKTGQVILEMNRHARRYLHVVPGTLGSDLGAGLFRK